jgi:hypothetical protein
MKKNKSYKNKINKILSDNVDGLNRNSKAIEILLSALAKEELNVAEKKEIQGLLRTLQVTTDSLNFLDN